jgi:glycosyltransferase involved in cell wall biosynthesis
MLVSIVLPTYNRAHCICRAIDSVLEQTLKEWELIIVDNYSTDGTDKILSLYKDTRIKIIKIHNNGVIAASRNKGIKESRGRYIAFLDSDDWWRPEKLNESIKILINGQDIIYHDLYLIREKFKWNILFEKVKTSKLNKPVFSDLIQNGNKLNNSSVVVRRDLMMRIGLLSEEPNLCSAEDFEAWIRLAKVTEKFYRIPKCLGYISVGKDNTSSSDKTIKSIGYILNTYSVTNVPWWASYELGKAYFKNGDNENSKIYFIKVIKNKSNIYIKIKALIFYFWCHYIIISN